MKHLNTILLATLIIGTIPTTLVAQELRLSGGYAGSNVRDAGTEEWAGRAGYQFGIDVLIGHRLFVKPGIHFLVRNLNYTILGVGENGLPNASETEFRYTSQALRIPAMVGVRLLDPPENKGFNMYAFAGPTALIEISTDIDNNALEVDTRSTQWYLGFGAGFEYKFLFLEGGYDVAMTNVFHGEGVNTNPKVNMIYVTAGLRFLLNM